MAIWNLGSINIDHVYRLDSLPRAGETLASRGYALGLGGKGANQSVAAAQAGAETRHLGAMGMRDRWVRERLREAGVDISGVQRLPDHVTGHAIILLDAAGENSIVIDPAANRAIDEIRLLRDLAPIGPGDTLLLQNETSCQPAAAKAARAQGARVIYSAAPFDVEAVRAILPHVTILAMNEGEAAQLAKAVAADLPVEGLLVTKGGAGAEYRDLRSGKIHLQPAFPVDVTDTTAAGDTFAGYFAAALDGGAAIPEALRLASAAAALKVTRPGAGDAIPSRHEVEAFLADQPG